LFKLPQRIETIPHGFIDHFGKLKGFYGSLTPRPFETDFKDSSHDSGSRLSDINFIDIEGVAFKRQPGNVGLEKGAYFGGGFLKRALDGNWDSFDEFF
jgi:hypothetical protein